MRHYCASFQATERLARVSSVDIMNMTQLQTAIIEEFAPRFAPYARVVHRKYAKSTPVLRDDKARRKLGLPAGAQSRLPDVILYAPRRRRLYLVERGPISPARYRELEEMLGGTTARRIYVSAFPSFREFSRSGDNIAWETRVWIAEAPDHLIHYNGGKVTPPRRRSKHKTG